MGPVLPNNGTIPAIRLFVTDLDGTILGPRDEHSLYASLRSKLAELTACGARWVICTGRSMTSFKQAFRPLTAAGIHPDFVISEHCYIYSMTQHGFHPHWLWNLQISQRIFYNRIKTRQVLRTCRDEAMRVFRNVSAAYRDRDRLCLRFRNSESAGVAAGLLRKSAHPNVGLLVTAHPPLVEIRTIPSTKGVAVRELARHLGIPRENILTIGDGLNDITMLDGSVAALTACPSNAVPQVRETVHISGGHIAGEPMLAGVMESLNAHLDGTVNSALPSHSDTGAVSMLTTESYSDGKRHVHASYVKVAWDVLLLSASILTVILFVADCGLMGGFSRIMKGLLNLFMNILVKCLPSL